MPPAEDRNDRERMKAIEMAGYKTQSFRLGDSEAANIALDVLHRAALSIPLVVRLPPFCSLLCYQFGDAVFGQSLNLRFQRL